MKSARTAKSSYSIIFIFSVCASLCLHGVAVFSLNKHLLAYSPLNKLFKTMISERKTDLLPKIKKEEVFIFSINQAQLSADVKQKEKSLGQNMAENVLPQAVAVDSDFKNIRRINEVTRAPSKEIFISSKSQVGNKPPQGYQKFSAVIDANYNLRSTSAQMEVLDKGVRKAEAIVDAKLNTNFTYPLQVYSKKENFITKDVSKIAVSYQMQKKDNTDRIISFFKKNLSPVSNQVNEPLVSYKEHTTCSIENIPDRPVIVSGVKQGEYKFPQQKPLFETTSFEQKTGVSDYLRKMNIKNQDFKPSESKKAPFLPFIPHIPSLDDLNTVSCGDDFDIDLEYVPRDDDIGYVFALTLIPKVERQFQRINQNFYFLIDKSNSIQGNRYTAARQAVVSSIKAMNKADTFNIYAFDNKIDSLFRKNNYPTHEC